MCGVRYDRCTLHVGWLHSLRLSHALACSRSCGTQWQQRGRVSIAGSRAQTAAESSLIIAAPGSAGAIERSLVTVDKPVRGIRLCSRASAVHDATQGATHDGAPSAGHTCVASGPKAMSKANCFSRDRSLPSGFDGS